MRILCIHIHLRTIYTHVYTSLPSVVLTSCFVNCNKQNMPHNGWQILILIFININYYNEWRICKWIKSIDESLRTGYRLRLNSIIPLAAMINTNFLNNNDNNNVFRDEYTVNDTENVDKTSLTINTRQQLLQQSLPPPLPTTAQRYKMRRPSDLQLIVDLSGQRVGSTDTLNPMSLKASQLQRKMSLHPYGLHTRGSTLRSSVRSYQYSKQAKQRTHQTRRPSLYVIPIVESQVQQHLPQQQQLASLTTTRLSINLASNARRHSLYVPTNKRASSHVINFSNLLYVLVAVLC